MSIVNMQIRQR